MEPKPYYQEQGITIYHGDCAEILPHIEPVDLLLTDPPYGMRYRSDHRAQKHDAIHGDDAMPVDTILAAADKARIGAYVYCRWDSIPQMPKPKSVLAWVKNQWTSGDLQHAHGRQWEACLFYPGPEHVFKKRTPDVIYAGKTDNAIHPTQKPIGAIAGILEAYEPCLVLDPYMGSGTTLVAAKWNGFRAIGIEREEKYCAAAVERLRQQTLFAC